MDSTTVKRIVAVLAIVLILIIVIAGIVRLATGTGNGEPEAPDVTSSLLNYDNSTSSVRLTIEGEIVAREEYREIRITISSNRRRLDIISGYSGNILRRQNLRNDQNAYSVFLRALNFEGFHLAQDNELGDDHRGICPDGTRTIAELYDGGERQFKLWSASCDEGVGTLDEDVDVRDIQSLFQDQIPDYRQLTRGVSL